VPSLFGGRPARPTRPCGQLPIGFLRRAGLHAAVSRPVPTPYLSWPMTAEEREDLKEAARGLIY
jgi:hypothetical protein